MRHSLTVVSFLFLAGNACAQDGYSAKSLFFAEDDSVVSASTGGQTPPAATQAKTEPITRKAGLQVAAAKKSSIPKHIGASYFIRLKSSDGSTRDVLATRQFKSGERFQLGVKVNNPTYVYVLNEAPDGKVTQIYPSHGHNNFVDAMGTVFLPAQGAFEFDNQPGTEKLLVYLSPSRIDTNMPEKIRQVSPDVVSIAPASLAATAACTDFGPMQAKAIQEPEKIALLGSDTGYATKGIAFKEDAATACAAIPANAERFATKGIVFSEDSEPTAGGQVASYIIKKNTATADKSLYLKINLVHE